MKKIFCILIMLIFTSSFAQELDVVEQKTFDDVLPIAPQKYDRREGEAIPVFAKPTSEDLLKSDMKVVKKSKKDKAKVAKKSSKANKKVAKKQTKSNKKVAKRSSSKAKVAKNKAPAKRKVASVKKKAVKAKKKAKKKK